VRLRKLSQDPTAGAEVVRLGSSMRAIEQFRRNIRMGVAKVETEDRVLDSLTTSLGRAAELAISQASSTATAETRLSVKAEVDAIIDFAVGLGNTRFGDDYLFAGTRGGEAPFRNPPVAGDFRALLDGGGNPVDPSGTIPVEVGDGRFVTPNHNGTDIFLDTNALAALRQLSEALGADRVLAPMISMRARSPSATSNSRCRPSAPNSGTPKSTRRWWSWWASRPCTRPRCRPPRECLD
jgi:flagellar hook-associated protein 3 FlgL